MNNSTISDKKCFLLPSAPILRLVFFYAVTGIIYIYTSDYLLELLIADEHWRSSVQTYKGIGFILLTSVLLFFMVRKYAETIRNGFETILNIRQLSEKQINEKSAEYNALFEHTPIPTWIIDFDTLNFIQVNEAACLNYGYTREEYLRMNIKDIRPEEDIPRLNEELFKSNGEDIYHVKEAIRHRKKNGETILVKVKASILFYQGKKVRLASAIDVTDETKNQETLLERNAILEQTSEIAGMGYWTFYIQNKELDWSNQMYKIFEQDPEKFVLNLENIKSCFHENDKHIFDQSYLLNMEAGVIYQAERRIYTPEHKIKWIFERLYLSQNQDGIPFKLQGIAVDISNRKRHEQDLQDSNERFKLLSKATVEAVIDWDIKQKKVFWGEGFQNIFGYVITEDTPNSLWKDNIHPEDREMALLELNNVINNKNQQFFTSEYRFLRANRTVARVQHKCIMIRDSNGVAVRMVGALKDLTETLNYVYQIEQQNTALRDISWTQSHLVRSPLTNIMGIVSLLREAENNPEMTAELLEGLESSAYKLDGIIREIVHKTLDSGKVERE